MAAGALVPERCFAAGLNVAEGLDSVAQKNLEGAGGYLYLQAPSVTWGAVHEAWKT